MTNQRKFPERGPLVRAQLTEREEWENQVNQLVYQALAAAGDTCRLLCSAHPDLLDSIAKGISDFLSDGDVFDQVARTLLELDPEYWGNQIGLLPDEIAKRVVGQVLGE